MASPKVPRFTGRTLLDLGTTPMVDYRRADVIFSPGDACDSVMYIQRGGVQLSVVSASGREAVVAVLGPGDFLGEGCLAGEPTRMRSATAIAPSRICIVAKVQMRRLLRRWAVSDCLLSHVLVRHTSLEQDLIDQLVSSTEKRLARTLLRLARYGTSGKPHRVVPKVSKAKLARLVGTTPERISALMDTFRRAGFIEDNGRLVINRSLLNVVLHD